MRILIAGSAFYPALNGQAVFTVNLAEGLARAGHEVAVVFPQQRASSRVRNRVRLEALGSVSLWLIHNEAYFPITYGKVRRVFEDFRPEITHIQDHFPLSVAAFRSARRLGIPVIGTNHFVPANLTHYFPGSALFKSGLEKALWEWMLRLYRQLDFVTAPSRAAVSLLEAQGLRVPLQPVSCGTDLTRFHPVPGIDRKQERLKFGLRPEGTLFITVGRVDHEKRLDVLIRALALTPDHIQLAIAGEGAAVAEFQGLVRSLDLAERVRFLGRVPNEELPRLLNSADVFAMASEAELLSIASLEAMASGLPLLLADALALTELVTPDENGYLFKPGDPADAAHWMQWMAGHPERWEAMGRLSLEKVKHHSLDATIERYAALYIQVIESAPALQPLPGLSQRNRGTEIAHRSGHP